MAYALPKLPDPNNYLYTWMLDKAIGLADGRTVVSSFFERRYGGVLAPQYVDTDLFDPARYGRKAMRQALGLDEYQLIVFAGIAHPSKGVGDIIAALRRLGSDRRDWRLVIVGPVTPYARALAEADDRVLLLGTQPPTRTPEFLAMNPNGKVPVIVSRRVWPARPPLLSCQGPGPRWSSIGKLVTAPVHGRLC